MALFELEKGDLVIVTDNEGNLERADIYIHLLDKYLDMTEEVKKNNHLMTKIKEGFETCQSNKQLADADNRIKYDKENTL